MIRPTNLSRYRQSQRRSTASANLIRKQLKGRQTPKDSGASSLSVDSSVSNLSSSTSSCFYKYTQIAN